MYREISAFATDTSYCEFSNFVYFHIPLRSELSLALTDAGRQCVVVLRTPQNENDEHKIQKPKKNCAKIQQLD